MRATTIRRTSRTFLLSSARARYRATPTRSSRRLFSPRKLDADTAYRAFVVPAFETGRLAGLADDPSSIDRRGTSVEVRIPVEMPYLLRMVLPHRRERGLRVAGEAARAASGRRARRHPRHGRVRTRDSASRTGADIGQIPPAPGNPPPPQTVLGLEGALRAPHYRQQARRYSTRRSRSSRELAAVLNLADDRMASRSRGHVDPLVTPPIYGGRHARKRASM